MYKNGGLYCFPFVFLFFVFSDTNIYLLIQTSLKKATNYKSSAKKRVVTTDNMLMKIRLAYKTVIATVNV